jgi:threonine synthase
VNSINWARILAQITYYFYAWGRLSGGDSGRKVTFSVPTGNFGDIFAGYMARRMGLPVERLVLATNRNDILSRFVNTGVYAAGEGTPPSAPPWTSRSPPTSSAISTSCSTRMRRR